MLDSLASQLLDKLGTPTLVMMAFAVLWDRVLKLEGRCDDHAEHLWEINKRSCKCGNKE